MSKLKVLALTHGGILNATGRQRYLPLFQRDDIDLTLVVPDKWYDFKTTIVPDYVAPGTNILIEKVSFAYLPIVKWYLHFYPSLGNLIKKLQPDVIHLWEEPWALVSLQADFLRKKYAPQAALILETDQNVLRKMPVPFEQLRRYMLQRTDLLIGRGVEALEVSQACGYNGPTEIVEYGIDRTNFIPGGKAEARKLYETSDTFTLGYVGRIVPYKGLADVLHAMHLCSKPIQFNILGAGEYQQEFERIVESLNLQNRVKIFGTLPAADVHQFIKSVDTLVLMSKTTKTWKEQFGRVIMESQACGVPVIGSDSGSIPDVVGPGGWIIKEGDYKALALLIDRLVDDPSDIIQKGEAGIKQADTRFNFDVIADALIRAYSSAVAHKISGNNHLDTSERLEINNKFMGRDFEHST